MPDMRYIKETLTNRLSELDEKLHEVEELLDQPHSKDAEDFATEVEDTEVLEGLGLAGQREVAAIRAALQRIKDGSYGICVKCGEDIAPARLMAVPFAPLCVKCA